MAGDKEGKKKILVIDDEERISELVKAILEKTGLYKVIIASNGDEGILRFKEEDPHLVISDLIMPGKSGFDVLKELRKPGVKWRPVIMLTARDDSAVRSFDLEADFYITKPFDNKVLLNAIETLLNLASIRDTEPDDEAEDSD